MGVAIAAVVLASAGTAVGQRALIDGSDIRDNSVSGRDIRNNSIAGADIRSRTIRSSDLSRGTIAFLQRGSAQTPRDPAPGPQGPQGPPGPQGPAGIAAMTQVRSARVAVAPGDVGSAQVFCPAGTAHTGTGFFASVGRIGFAQKFGTSTGIGVLNDTSITIEIEAQAICASGPGVQASSRSRAARLRERDRKAFERKLAQLRQAR